MPVDRESRTAVAEVLASFMRGELDTNGMHARLKAIRAARPDATSPDEYLDSLLGFESSFWRWWSLSESEWKQLCRHLAFLKSDLHQRDSEPSLSNTDVDESLQILLARWHAVGLVVASGVAFLSSWWVLAAACLVSFLLYQISMCRQDCKSDAKLKEALAFDPFASEQEWLTYEALLEEFHLPKYDPNRHRRPFLPRIAGGILIGAHMSVIVAVLLLMYVSSIFLWPVWLVLMAFRSRKLHDPA